MAVQTGVEHMTMEVARAGAAAARKPCLLLLALAALGLAACEGDTMKRGEPGPSGPTGPSGPPAGSTSPQPIGSAESIVAKITAVTVPDDGRPVVDVFLVDQENRPLAGLPAGNIRFVLARLEPGVNGKSNSWRAITRRTESFPGTPSPTPADRVTGTGPANQGYTETATAGGWTDNNNGTFRYRFAKSLKDDPAAPYDPSMNHRVGLEIRTSPNLSTRNIPANNATYTFLPPGGPDIAQSGREIVDNGTCNACHDNLQFHGDARFDLKYCVMCHEANSFDAQSGNSLEMRVMIHKIHSGETLPSVKAGGFYGIFGFGNTFTDYSDLVYPQDKRNCQTCHQESDASTPQASNWRLVVDRQSCGSCHDNVNFDTGANHGGVAATDDQCTSCHGPNSNFGLRPDQVHFDPLLVAGAKFRYEVLQVVDSAPGQRPTVTIRVTDPTNNNAPYDIRAAGGPFQIGNSALRVDVAWSTRPDFTNTGSGSATAVSGTPAQPISIDFKANGVPDPAFAGAFKATAARPIPAGATGSGSALLEGRPNVRLDLNGDGVLETVAVPVDAAGKAFAITDAVPVPYRQVVDIAKCNDCHEQLSLHGENRTGNVELCAVCHNPNATDINRRVAGSSCESVTGTLDDQTIDLKVMVHAIHAGALANYKVCGYNNTGYDFSHVRYPGKLNNCEGCHLPGTYYPPDAATAIATTLDAAPATNPDRATPLGDIAVTPGTAVCSSCHTGALAKAHMEQSGGSFSAVKAADSSTPGTPVETCGTCHGPGRSADVKVIHGVGQFNSN